MKRVLLLVIAVLAGSAVAQHAPAVKPRAQAKDYQAVVENANATIGAAQLSRKQVRKTFVSNMRKDYVVIEVGVYPKNVGIKLSPSDFTLRAANSDKPISPADPKIMASQINEKDQKGTDVAVYPYETVTYSTGGDPYDPYYGTHGGLTTTTGVNVVTKPNQRDPKTRAGDKSAMIAELTEKSLPESEISRPTGGYIYFPVNNETSTTYTLEYTSADGTKLLIPLPAPTE